MTAATFKSVGITNIESVPRISYGAREGFLKGVTDEFAVTTTSIDEIDDIILIGKINSNATLVDMEFMNTAIDTDNLLVGNIGLYYSGSGGQQQSDSSKASGVVIDADCIATECAILSGPNTSFSSFRYEAASVASIDSPAYILGNLTEDPGGYFYIGFKVTTAAGTPVAGTLSTLITTLER